MKTPKRGGGPDLDTNRVNPGSLFKNERVGRLKNDLPTYKPFAFLNTSMLRGVESEEDSLPKGIGDAAAWLPASMDISFVRRGLAAERHW